MIQIILSLACPRNHIQVTSLGNDASVAKIIGTTNICVKMLQRKARGEVGKRKRVRQRKSQPKMNPVKAKKTTRKRRNRRQNAKETKTRRMTSNLQPG